MKACFCTDLHVLLEFARKVVRVENSVPFAAHKDSMEHHFRAEFDAKRENINVTSNQSLGDNAGCVGDAVRKAYNGP